MRNDIAYNSIRDVVQAGLVLAGTSSGISDNQFMMWFVYSSNALDSKYINPSIYTNYLRLQLLTPNATASQKLNACLIYLLEVMKTI